MLYSLVSSEIILKGKNRNVFQNVLIRDIRSALGKVKVSKQGARLLVQSENPEAIDRLQKIFGIDYVFPSVSVKPDMASIREALSSYDFSGKAIRVVTKRSDKGFPLKSTEVNSVVGQDLVDRGAKVDLDHPERNIYIDILRDQAILSVERFKGHGGLPVGTSGKVLSLLSGGFDSPVASWLMMRRGCMVDLLHMHSHPRNEDILGSKIMRIAKTLKEYHQPRMRLFAVPYSEFYKSTLDLGSRYELVVFRRFLLRLGNRLAEEHGHKALVTGDSLGQVASQTLSNLSTTDAASELPVLRPLIGFSKQEIIDQSIRIGLHDHSLEPYKDCCSLVAHRSPSTRVKKGAAEKMEDDLGMDGILDRALEQCDVFDV